MNFGALISSDEAEFRLLFHGWPDVYFDGDIGGAFLVRLVFGDSPSHRGFAWLTEFKRVFTFGFSNGGPAGLVYGFIICWIGTIALYCSLAEMASA